MKKKFLSLAVALTMFLLTACQGAGAPPGGSNNEVDDTKTQLVVATYDGGLDHEWILDSATRFEEKYADVSFEEGKKGVQVRVVKSSNYNGLSVLDTMHTEDADVWFTEHVNYQDHINRDNFADITDIVTEPLAEYGEDKSIADKIEDGYRDFLNVGTESEPQYYAIPFYDGIYGLVYDKDLFAKENLYFKSSGSEVGDSADNLEFVSSESDTKSAGVDGKLGTYDDGLPATYAQFLKVFDKMRESKITPIVYGGGNAMEYPTRMLASFWAQAEGAEGYNLNNTFNGTADNLVVLDAEGKVQKNADGSFKTESLAITVDNGYELQRQETKLQVLKLFEEIVGNEENYSSSSLQHTAAQSDFLKGKEDQFTTYGFLIDGTWWENEADESFKALASRFGEEHERDKRNLAFMPLPVPTAEEVGQGNSLLNLNTSLAFIRSNTEIMDCAKAFLQFTTTDAELSAFTANVSMTRSLNYELTEEYKDKVTPYGLSLFEMKKASTVIYPYSDIDVFQKNQAFFAVEKWSWQTTLANSEYTNPWLVWLTFKGQYSAETYFEGMHAIQKTKWGTLTK